MHERVDRAETEAARRTEEAQRAAREEIAREMHDVLGHRLSLLSLHAGALEFSPGAPEAEIARTAAVIRESAHQALQELRTVIGVLRAPTAEESGGTRPQAGLGDLERLFAESREAGRTSGPGWTSPPRKQSRPVGRVPHRRTGRRPRPDRPLRTGRAGGRPAHVRPGRRRVPPEGLATVGRMIRLLVVDDDPLVRSGLHLLFAGADGIDVVAEAADGTEVQPLVRAFTPPTSF
ncbi:hybrid sensor histidine kinase/response regulator transcription factor [Streptomyces sp. NPDC127097]|uniref:helix-turn-helix transcriptional regulator n=1 Tax=Streptomyces sp. NPDC127097 TaxID=3347136 RepID=UPI003653FE37